MPTSGKCCFNIREEETAVVPTVPPHCSSYIVSTSTAGIPAVVKVCRPSSSQPSGTSSQIFPSSETQDDIVWQICFSSKRKKIYLGVCMTGRVRGKEQGKRHASPRQIVRSDDLVSGSDDSGGGVRSDRAKVLYWHWKASGNDGRSVARKKRQ